jgi:hypothetical protein
MTLKIKQKKGFDGDAAAAFDIDWKPKLSCGGTSAKVYLFRFP